MFQFPTTLEKPARSPLNPLRWFGGKSRDVMEQVAATREQREADKAKTWLALVVKTAADEATPEEVDEILTATGKTAEDLGREVADYNEYLHLLSSAAKLQELQSERDAIGEEFSRHREKLEEHKKAFAKLESEHREIVGRIYVADRSLQSCHDARNRLERGGFDRFEAPEHRETRAQVEAVRRDVASLKRGLRQARAKADGLRRTIFLNESDLATGAAWMQDDQKTELRERIAVASDKLNAIEAEQIPDLELKAEAKRGELEKLERLLPENAR